MEHSPTDYKPILRNYSWQFNDWESVEYFSLFQPDSLNLLFSAPCWMLLSSASSLCRILACLTQRSLLFLISVRLLIPCCWKEITPFGKKLFVLWPWFFPPLKGMHVFHLTQSSAETYPIGTWRSTHIQPRYDPSTGLQEWDVSAFLCLTQQREEKPDSLQTQDSFPEELKPLTFLLSSISNHCWLI